MADLEVYGQRGSDRIDGAGWADGGRGDDTFIACAMGSEFYGDDGEDTFYANDGVDVLHGGGGWDGAFGRQTQKDWNQ